MSKEKKLRIFDRDGYKCYICGDWCIPGGKKSRKGFKLATIDHFIPISKGGSNKDTNLKTCCKSCNEKKGSKILTKIPKFIVVEKNDKL